MKPSGNKLIYQWKRMNNYCYEETSELLVLHLIFFFFKISNDKEKSSVILCSISTQVLNVDLVWVIFIRWDHTDWHFNGKNKIYGAHLNQVKLTESFMKAKIWKHKINTSGATHTGYTNLDKIKYVKKGRFAQALEPLHKFKI